MLFQYESFAMDLLLLLAFLKRFGMKTEVKQKCKVLKQKTQNSKTGGWRFREASSILSLAEERQAPHGLPELSWRVGRGWPYYPPPDFRRCWRAKPDHEKIKILTL